MSNQPYVGAFDKEADTRAAINRLAEQSGRKEAEARERSQQILDYYSHRKRKDTK